MTGLPAGHSSYSIQPAAMKLKNVDYYKLMKEKYVLKREQIEIKNRAAQRQGLGAITIVNVQKGSAEPSPAETNKKSKLIKLPRQGSTIVRGADTVNSTNEDLSIDFSKISALNYMAGDSNTAVDSLGHHVVPESPAFTKKIKSQTVSKK